MSEFEESKLYYYTNLRNKPECGRGEAVRLLLEDAGVNFGYERIELEKWPHIKKRLVEEGHYIPTLPYLITKSGKFYDRVTPLMKRISKGLGRYIPSNSDDEYLVDKYSDLYLDWRTKWVNCFYVKSGEKDEETRGTNWIQCSYVESEVKEAKDKYNKELFTQYSNWNSILGDKGGPYVLGEEITYVDFQLYSILREDDDFKTHVKDYTNIAKFVNRFEDRPSLQKFFAKRYYPKLDQ